jgi:hypothetical protein
MSFNHEIGPPFALATLSKPVGSTNGRAHAAGVCSISGIKKRKRTEIAVGLDGEGVSIYSVCASVLYNEALLMSKAPKSSTYHIICPATKRKFHHRALLHISQR